MRKLMIVVMSCFGGFAAQAQTVMDGSDKIVGTENMTVLQEILLKELTDPFAAQLIKLHIDAKIPFYLCGMINIRNKQGGYEGFIPFRAVVTTERFELEPKIPCNL